ncbi:hypothetical protein B0H13DRAFT_2523379 [Mycena leptocephala]|nr:hypothetical protein B0H13DRAFT_2523379 [Mycena leptocephala]
MSHNPPRLPLELERLIFETAAVSRPMSIVDFMLVAWRVKNWQVTLHLLMILMTMAVGYRTEPLLYRVVLLCRAQERQISGFPVLPPEIMRRIIADKPPKFLLDPVRHLLFDTTVERSEVQTILTACTHVANLFAYTVSNWRLGALVGLQHLRRLAINVYELLELCHKDPTPVRNLTHLELFNSFSASNYSYSDTDDRMGNVPDLCAYLAHMPHLTHIAFNSRLPRTAFYTALCANPGIVCIVANVAATPDLSRRSRLGVADLDRVESSHFIDSSRLESTSSRSQPSCTVCQKNAFGDKLGTWSNFVTGVTESRLVTLCDIAVTAEKTKKSLLRFFNLQST